MHSDKEVFDDVYWIDGLLITAKHMQLIKRALIPQFITCIENSVHSFWGVIDLIVRTDNISNGIVEINKLFAINKDGTIINFNGSVKVDLTKIKEDGEHKIYVSTANCYNINDRYEILESSIDTESDEIQESNKPLILKVKPSFVFKHEIAGQNSYMPIMKTLLNLGSYSLINYTPPCNFLDKNNEVIKNVIELSRVLNSKLQKIKERLSYLIQNSIFSLETIDVNRIYQTVSYFVPKMYIVLNKEKVSVDELFAVVSEAYYGLHTCLKLPVKHDAFFDKEEINNSFYRMIDFIKNKIDLLLNNDFTFEGISTNDNGIFVFDYNKEALIGEDMVFGIYADKVADSWIENAIIGKESDFETILSERVIGIPRSTKKEITEIKAQSNLSMIFFTINSKYLEHGTKYLIDMGNYGNVSKIGYYKLI